MGRTKNPLVDLHEESHGLCRELPRPCEFYSCRHNLGADKKPEETCALDLADRGGMRIGEVAAVFGVTRQDIDYIQHKARRKLRERVGDAAATRIFSREKHR